MKEKQSPTVSSLWNKSNWFKLLIVIFFPFFLVFMGVIYIMELEKISNNKKAVIITSIMVLFMSWGSFEDDSSDLGTQSGKNYENEFRACERQRDDISKQKDECVESNNIVGKIQEETEEISEVALSEDDVTGENAQGSNDDHGSEPEISEEQKQYLSHMTIILDDFSTILIVRSELSFKFAEWDEDDRAEFTRTGEVIESIYDEIMEIDPPQELVSVHEKAVGAIKLYKQSVPLANKGIDDLDVDSLNASMELMEEGNEHIGEATEELDKYLEKVK